jgi:hypothetical protein
MTTTTWTFAPAGVLGQGSFDVRPYPGVVVCPTPEAVRGTGLPAVGLFADERAAADVVRLRSLTAPVAVLARTDAPAAQKFIAQQSTQNDGTTLGIHTPGRPRS